MTSVAGNTTIDVNQVHTHKPKKAPAKKRNIVTTNHDDVEPQQERRTSGKRPVSKCCIPSFVDTSLLPSRESEMVALVHAKPMYMEIKTLSKHGTTATHQMSPPPHVSFVGLSATVPVTVCYLEGTTFPANTEWQLLPGDVWVADGLAVFGRWSFTTTEPQLVRSVWAACNPMQVQEQHQCYPLWPTHNDAVLHYLGLR